MLNQTESLLYKHDNPKSVEQIIGGFTRIIRDAYEKGKNKLVISSSKSEEKFHFLQKMLHKDHFGFLKIEAYNNESRMMNHVLQFTAGPIGNDVCQLGTIHVHEGDSVYFYAGERILAIISRPGDADQPEEIVEIVFMK